jgi:hypothetical protein
MRLCEQRGRAHANVPAVQKLCGLRDEKKLKTNMNQARSLMYCERVSSVLTHSFVHLTGRVANRAENRNHVSKVPGV